MADRATEMPAGLIATLAAVARALNNSADPWWIIGSAAMVLHGVDTEAADVDVLVSIRDADALFRVWQLDHAGGAAATGRFRSDRFARYEKLPVPVEIMAGFRVRTERSWLPIMPGEGIRVRVGGEKVIIPLATDLIKMCSLFGRDKDVSRKAKLEALIAARPATET